MPIKDSELILNPDGSIYHLKVKAEHIADTILLVGDQDRVEKITRHFDKIEFSQRKREFKTQTGIYKGKRLTVMSTGIGPDNIDIVINEVDAAVNIDPETRTINKNLRKLDFIRVGTSGGLDPDVPVDSFVMSTHGFDMNGNLHYYQIEDIRNRDFEEAFVQAVNWNPEKAYPLLIEGSKELQEKLNSNEVYKGVTATAGGFYGPQGRIIRLPIYDETLNTKIDNFEYKGMRFMNFEMETSVIYALSKMLGHNALSMNAIINNRPKGTFSINPADTIERLIIYVLNKLAE